MSTGQVPELNPPSSENLARKENLTRKSFAGTGWTTLATAGRLVLQLLSVAVLARLLGPDSYGLMGMAALLLNFLVNFRDLGTAAAIIRLPEVSHRLLCSLFWVNMALGLLFTVIVVLSAKLVALFFHEPRLVGVLQMLSLSFLLTAAGIVQNAILAREMSFGKIAAADLASAVAGYLVALPCAFAGFGVQSLIFANIVNCIVASAIYWALCPWRPTLEFDLAEIRSVRSFSLNFSGFGLINYFGRNADNIIVGKYLGEVQLGYYQMAYNLMMYPIQNVTGVISQVLLPAFSRIQDDDERFRSAYVRSCMLIGLITFPLIAGLGVVADPFVRTVLGAKWIPAIVVFQILAPVGMVQSVWTTIGQIYVAKGRTDWMFRWGVYSTVIYVAAFLIGVRFGIEGVAGTYAIAFFGLVVIPGFVIPFRLIGLRFTDFIRQLLPQFAITLSMVALCWLWMAALRSAGINSPLVNLASTSILGIVAYISLMLWFHPRVLQHLENILVDLPRNVASPLLRIIRATDRRRTPE